MKGLRFCTAGIAAAVLLVGCGGSDSSTKYELSYIEPTLESYCLSVESDQASNDVSEQLGMEPTPRDEKQQKDADGLVDRLIAAVRDSPDAPADEADDDRTVKQFASDQVSTLAKCDPEMADRLERAIDIE